MVSISTLSPSCIFWGMLYSEISKGITFAVLLVHSRPLDYSFCWPFNLVPYKIDPNFTPYQRNYIKEQVAKINKNTCVYWSDIKDSNSLRNTTVFVRFRKTAFGTCSTRIAYPYRNFPLDVEIRLLDSCFELKVVLHEMLHAMGFLHEHQRVDRDCYVWISDSIKKHISNEIDSYYAFYSIDRFPYDKLSIMHYKRSNVMKSLTERFYQWEPLGNQEEHMSDLDLWKIQYRFCGRPHYCDVHAQHCRDMERWESEMDCIKWY